MAKSHERCTEDEFIALFKNLQSSGEVAKKLGCSERAVHSRKRAIEARRGIILPVFDPRRPHNNVALVENKAVAKYSIDSGTILVGSDAHIWPGPLTTMQRAFLWAAKELKPKSIVANGDWFDGARVSRWPHGSWSDEKSKPSVRQELEAVQDYMGEVARIAPGAKRFWPLGNHDARYESKLVAQAPEFTGVPGTSLRDHFPLWLPCWRVDVNDDVIIRHRELGGEHADYRNALSTGLTIVTGHDHRANVTAYTSYRGTVFGVRCGYMADSPTDPQFVNYLEARQPNWQPAFAVLTFRDGRLLWPELVVRHDEGVIAFRGQLITV